MLHYALTLKQGGYSFPYREWYPGGIRHVIEPGMLKNQIRR
jgi:hypothetical protein